jgi:hypothetical protein
MTAYKFHGTLLINAHCGFPCEEWEGTPQRAVQITGDQCLACIAELRRIAPRCAFRLKDSRMGTARRG